jgi:hypothetical protein
VTSDKQVQIVRHGRWKKGDRSGYVWIIRQNWDYFHEDFYDEGPDLNADGFAYYALYGTVPQVSEHTSRSPTCPSEADAAKRAETLLGEVDWLGQP